LCQKAADLPLKVTRLLDQPIIRPDMDDRMGGNINGPAVLRVPDWVETPLGRYYLYFADHKGSYIRMAFADALTGPWTLHTPGVLDLKDSLFPTEDPEPPAAEDVPDFAECLGDFLYAHIASPDVHVDHERRRIRLYYHGLIETGDQATRVAYSPDGLAFTPRPPLLGPPYFRVFEYGGAFYTIPWAGRMWRSDDWDSAFEEGPLMVPLHIDGPRAAGFRHGECHRVGDTLHLLFHRIGDAPECLLHTKVDLRPDWRDWRIGEIATLLTPGLTWEGADLPAEPSVMGAVHTRVCELRDPCVFEVADGRTFLFYVGAGESGIGVASIEGF
jgi:hypothetical protein